MEMSLLEAERAFGKKRGALTAAIKDGRLPGRKAGGAWFVMAEDIVKAIQDGKLQAGPGRPRKRQGETPAEEKALDEWTEKTLAAGTNSMEGGENDGTS